MGDARKPTALDDQDKKLDPQNFAYISDDTYTAEEVEAQTQVGAGASPPPPQMRLLVAVMAGRRQLPLACACNGQLTATLTAAGHCACWEHGAGGHS